MSNILDRKTFKEGIAFLITAILFCTGLIIYTLSEKWFIGLILVLGAFSSMLVQVKQSENFKDGT